MYCKRNRLDFSENFLEEEIEAASSSDERSLSISKELPKKKSNILRIKFRKIDQCCESANDFLTEDFFYKPGNNFFSSEKSLVDQKPIREYNVSDCREKDFSLNHKTHRQLNDNNAGSAISEEENTNDVTNECPKVEEVPLLTRSEHICSVCGRCFKSMKSLSGHMRCHPERDWRGIQPPSAAKNSPSSTISESTGLKMDDQNDSATTTETSDFNEPKSLLRWTVTAKRGRNAAMHEPKVQYNLEDMDPIELEAIETLLSLANADPRELAYLKRKEIDRESEVKIPNFTYENSKFYEGDILSGDGFGSEHMVSDSRVEILKKLNRPMKELSYRTEFRKLSKNSSTQHSKTVDEKRKIGASVGYVCATCNKSFSSYQALGGHRASHRKGKNGTTEGEVDELTGDVEDDRCEIEDITHHKALPATDEAGTKTAILHRCKTCNKTFPSGQALGGHQRCHYSGPTEAPVNLVVLQEEDANTGHPVEAPINSVMLQEDDRNSSHQLRNFDLNELPMVED